MWSVIDRFAGQGVQFVMSIIIARLVLPSDYGLIAMLTIFLAIAQTFVDSGFSSALVQKKDRTETDYSTVFFFNAGVGVLTYLLLFFSAPFIAGFYNEPQLVAVTRVAGLALIINSFEAVQLARLTISLDFKKIAIATLTSVTISGAIGIWMAYNGYGVWALVVQSLSNYTMYMVLLWIISRWHPKLVFSIKSFKTLFSFGSKLLLSSLLHTVYVNLYSLVIGKFFAAKELGYFNRASVLAMFPSTNLSNVIMRVVYPVQCSMQDDNEQLIKYFKQYLKVSCFVIFPIMIGLCVLAEPLVLIILKEKWLPAVPYLQILCIAYMWDPIMKLNGSILNAKGRSDLFFKAEIIKKITAFLILAATIPFGIKIMCFGLIFYAFADIRIITIYTNKLVGLNLMTQVKALIPVLLLTATMGLVIYFSTLLFGNPYLKLVLGTGAGLAYFGLVSRMFHFKEFDFIYSLIKSKLRKT
ncbi:MAG: lipopolysaccharide biosynthesis protein [Bacteroidales bacterium]